MGQFCSECDYCAKDKRKEYKVDDVQVKEIMKWQAQRLERQHSGFAMASIMKVKCTESSRERLQRLQRANQLSKYIDVTPEGSVSRLDSERKSPIISEAEQKEDQLYWALAEAKMLDDKTPEVFEADLNDSEVRSPLKKFNEGLKIKEEPRKIRQITPQKLPSQ